MVPNLPAPIRPTVTGRPAASRSSSRECRFTVFLRADSSLRRTSYYRAREQPLLAHRLGDERLVDALFVVRLAPFGPDDGGTAVRRGDVEARAALKSPSPGTAPRWPWTQSGAPFGALMHISLPLTTFVSGSRATVPAASPTPLATSPAASVAPPRKRPIALSDSAGVGRPRDRRGRRSLDHRGGLKRDRRILIRLRGSRPGAREQRGGNAGHEAAKHQHRETSAELKRPRRGENVELTRRAPEFIRHVERDDDRRAEPREQAQTLLDEVADRLAVAAQQPGDR